MNALDTLNQVTEQHLEKAVEAIFNELFAQRGLEDYVSNADLVAALKQVANERAEDLVINASCK